MGSFDNEAMQEAQRYFQQAYDNQKQGRVDEAIEAYQRSIELCPTAEAHTFLGWALSMKGRYQAAIQECRKAIEIDPDFGNPYNDIGAYLIETGKADEALKWLEKAIQAKRYDCYCYPHYNMGRIWEMKNDWEKALRCYQQAIIEKSDYALAKRAVNRVLGMMN